MFESLISKEVTMITLDILALLFSGTSMPAPASTNFALSSSEPYPPGLKPSQCSRVTFNPWNGLTSASNTSILDDIPSLLKANSGDQFYS